MIEKAINHYLKQQNQTKLSPKAVLFDMDGILYDSMPYHVKAWLEATRKEHLEGSMEDFYLFEGCVGGYTINKLFYRTFHREATQEEIERIYKEKSRLFNTYNEGRPMAGAIDVLEQVKASGLQRLVVTGSGQHSLIDKLERMFPGHFIREKMVTAYDVTHGKPDPEPYLKGLVKAKVKANEAFIIENAPMGVRAGVAAGIFTIAVNTGPLPDSALLDEGANLLYPDMQSLANDWQHLMHEVKTYSK